jgi:hypothetical protein
MTERQVTVSFYESRGYRPVGDAPFFDKRLDDPQRIAPTVSLLEREDVSSWSRSISDLCRSISPGLDLSREVQGALVIGKALVAMSDSGALNGLAVLHTEGSRVLGGHQLRLLLVDPTSPDRKDVGTALLSSCEATSYREGAGRLFFTTTIDDALVDLLVTRKYRILGTNVRLIKGEGEIRWWDGNIISWTG